MKLKLIKLFHKIHHFGLKGTVETWFEEGTLMVGYRCSCGELLSRVKTPFKAK